MHLYYLVIDVLRRHSVQIIPCQPRRPTLHIILVVVRLLLHLMHCHLCVATDQDTAISLLTESSCLLSFWLLPAIRMSTIRVRGYHHCMLIGLRDIKVGEALLVYV